MHLLPLVLLPLTAQAINIVSSNDDGWAEINIRQFYKALTAAGHSVVVSAPAENQSGTGSSDKTPTTLTKPCEFNSCPSGSPATGHNASDPRLNYVNSYPATSMKYGISTAAPPFFNGAPPALAVSGPNVGSNLGLAVYFSGTVGAAHYASEAGIPAIAFSGSSGSQTAWNAAVPAYSQVYAQLATKITNKVVASGTPYLPDQVWLNVNFPEVSNECASADDFKFVLSRIFSGVFSADDVKTCGSSRLPTESTVVGTDGCYVSISVGWSDKTDAAADVQAIVLDKLGDLLVCLP
ncbi:acid phosphatase [Aspergillus udagawae]|uniref:Acid phosphatase n=1 Tax=Aspergillus udagawae TaxID=91492 RepID=A0ABQ1AN69_9EURO|nr:acid phosphatase [Aspergillus udagawae]GFF84998.1 acid phosphatase [Aspergillus udagawae]GFG03409.1 acid phosphatase [Aspergillus udagawae]